MRRRVTAIARTLLLLAGLAGLGMAAVGPAEAANECPWQLRGR